jgi:hypothetical protein
VASRRVADAFLVPDMITRAAVYPPFTSLHQPIFFARTTLAQFLAHLGPAKKPDIALKPWEHAVANRHGHSTMLHAAGKWTTRLESRAKAAAGARERLQTWAADLLEQEAKREITCHRQHEQRPSTATCGTSQRGPRADTTPAQKADACGVGSGKPHTGGRSVSNSKKIVFQDANPKLSSEAPSCEKLSARPAAHLIPRPPHKRRVTQETELEAGSLAPITVRGLLAGTCI